MKDLVVALACMIIFDLTRLRNTALYDGKSRQKVLLCDSAKSVDSIWDITMHTVEGIKFGMDKLPTLLTKEPQACTEVRHLRDDVVLQKVKLWSDSTPPLPTISFRTEAINVAMSLARRVICCTVTPEQEEYCLRHAANCMNSVL